MNIKKILLEASKWEDYITDEEHKMQISYSELRERVVDRIQANFFKLELKELLKKYNAEIYFESEENQVVVGIDEKEILRVVISIREEDINV